MKQFDFQTQKHRFHELDWQDRTICLSLGPVPKKNHNNTQNQQAQNQPVEKKKSDKKPKPVTAKKVSETKYLEMRYDLIVVKRYGVYSCRKID